MRIRNLDFCGLQLINCLLNRIIRLKQEGAKWLMEAKCTYVLIFLKVMQRLETALGLL